MSIQKTSIARWLKRAMDKLFAPHPELVRQRRDEWFDRDKVPIHRDEVAKIFMEHCHQEADKLLASIIPPLRAYCDGKDGRPTFDSVISRPLMAFDAGQFKSKPAERALIASHCYAIATTIGLDTVYRHIDPYSQAQVLEWMVYKLIIEEDVGLDNVGAPPSPWIKPTAPSNVVAMSVQWAPGTFKHGLPSQQKQLTDRYIRLSASQKVVVLLMALKVFRPRRGVSKVLYHETDFGGGVVGLNRIGTVQPDPGSLDEWENDLQISDADAALSELPRDFVNSMISAIDAVDPFWPAFGKSHRVTWK